MSEEDVLHAYFDPSLGDGAGSSASSWATKNNSISLIETDDLLESANKLQQGEGDLLVCSAEWAISNPSHGLTVLGALPRKEPTMILVSEDKMEYLPKGAIISTDIELCRRQLIRARPDLVIVKSENIQSENSQFEDSGGDVARTIWLEERRQEGIIDGFVTNRSLFDAAKIKSRRHTLGLQRGESGRQRFLPPPWQGFTLLMGRSGANIQRKKWESIISDLDHPAFLAFNLESRILRGIGDDILPYIGIHACLRQIGTVLRELNEEEDLQLIDELTDAYGKPRSTKPRAELMIELLNGDGSVSISVERISPEEEAMEAAVRLLQTFEDLLEIATMEHEYSPRLGDARPPMMKLDE